MGSYFRVYCTVGFLKNLRRSRWLMQRQKEKRKKGTKEGERIKELPHLETSSALKLHVRIEHARNANAAHVGARHAAVHVNLCWS